MTELLQAELLRRLAVLEARVELLAHALAQHVNACQAATSGEPGAAPEPGPTPPWRITSPGGAL